MGTTVNRPRVRPIPRPDALVRPSDPMDDPFVPPRAESDEANASLDRLGLRRDEAPTSSTRYVF